MPSDVKKYLRQAYTRRVHKVEHEGVTEFVAFIEEIPWIRVHADEREEAYLLLNETLVDALQAMIEAGDDIPVPEKTIERFGSPRSEEEEWRWSTSVRHERFVFEPPQQGPDGISSGDGSDQWASGDVAERDAAAAPV